MNCVGNNRPVSEWSDDKTLCAAQVLVLIGERDISDGYPRFVYVFLEVKATLFQPLKVIRRSHVEATLKTVRSMKSQDFVYQTMHNI